MNFKSFPFIIPVFIPHAGCPHQCAFCNQYAITHQPIKKNLFLKNLRSITEEYLTYKKDKVRHVQIAFYGGNFLGLKKTLLKSLLSEAKKLTVEKKIDSIRFSTRPDTISEQLLDICKDYPVRTIEIGAQSMDDEVLLKSRRGHSSFATEKAVELVKKKNFELGVQMMTGLPCDDEAKAFYTGKQIAKLEPDFVRIYPTVILKNTLLERWFNKGEYKPFSLEKSVFIVKKLYLLFRSQKIKVIRMGLQSSTELDHGSVVIAGPYHPAFGHLVHSKIFFDLAISAIKKKVFPGGSVIIMVHPKSVSKMRGINNTNIKRLKDIFFLKKLRIIPNSSIAQDNIEVL